MPPFEYRPLEILAPGLRVEIRGAVLLLIFDDASSKNAISVAHAEALAAFVQPDAFSARLAAAAQSGLEIGALALVSRVPGVFVSGGDLRELATATEEQGNTLTIGMRTFCAALSTLPIPSFALLAAPAYGGGTEIALACDFRVLQGSGSFAPALHFWQTKWAVPGGWHGMARLGELCPSLGARRVSLMFAAARSLGVDEMRALGLADFTCQGEELTALVEVEHFAQGFLACPNDLRADLLARGAVRSLDASHRTLRQHDEALFARHWLSGEHRRRLCEFAARKKTP